MELPRLCRSRRVSLSSRGAPLVQQPTSAVFPPAETDRAAGGSEEEPLGPVGRCDQLEGYQGVMGLLGAPSIGPEANKRPWHIIVERARQAYMHGTGWQIVVVRLRSAKKGGDKAARDTVARNCAGTVGPQYVAGLWAKMEV